MQRRVGQRLPEPLAAERRDRTPMNRLPLLRRESRCRDKRSAQSSSRSTGCCFQSDSQFTRRAACVLNSATRAARNLTHVSSPPAAALAVGTTSRTVQAARPGNRVQASKFVHLSRRDILSEPHLVDVREPLSARPERSLLLANLQADVRRTSGTRISKSSNLVPSMLPNDTDIQRRMRDGTWGPTCPSGRIAWLGGVRTS